MVLMLRRRMAGAGDLGVRFLVRWGGWVLRWDDVDRKSDLLPQWDAALLCEFRQGGVVGVSAHYVGRPRVLTQSPTGQQTMVGRCVL